MESGWKIVGSLRSDRELVVRGEVEGEVRAPRVVVEGKVRGVIHGETEVLLAASAVVEADICSPRVSVASGASFRGSIVAFPPGTEKEEEAQAAAPEPPAEAVEGEALPPVPPSAFRFGSPRTIDPRDPSATIA